MHAHAILLIGSIASAGEIRLLRSDTVEADGTRYVYLGRDSADSGHVLVTGSGRTWMHAFPSVGRQHPAGTFGFTSHEGRVYKVLETSDTALVLDRSDRIVPPHLLPPAYAVLQGLQASLVLHVREHRHRFQVTGMAASADGNKDVTLIPSYNDIPEPGITLSPGQSFRFREVTLTLLAAAQTGAHQACILAYSPIHAAAIRPNPATRSQETPKSKGRRPLFAHPSRQGVSVTPAGRTLSP